MVCNVGDGLGFGDFFWRQPLVRHELRFLRYVPRPGIGLCICCLRWDEQECLLVRGGDPCTEKSGNLHPAVVSTVKKKGQEQLIERQLSIVIVVCLGFRS